MSASTVNRRLARFALDRFGYGPRPESIDQVASAGVERWLTGQLEPPGDPDLEGRLSGLQNLGQSIRDVILRSEADQRVLTQLVAEFSTAHLVRAVHGKNQLEAVLTDFWFNHFNVYIGDPLVRLGIVRYEADAIRPHVLGRFRDLLGAVANSWAMMTYLDNYLSTSRNINENYARELMELHTMGVDGGYAQRDVEEVARAFTGWGIDRRAGTFAYRNDVHDQGTKTVLGQSLPQGQGKKDGEDILDILARHPSTARFISLKLARRFVSDDPPAALVTRMADTFSRSGGDIRQVMRTLIGSPEFWQEAFGPGKIKTPHEFVLSALRAVGAEVTSAAAVLGASGTASLTAMGMPTYEALDPTGWSDRGTDWIPNPGSHLARMNFVLRLASEAIPGIAVDLRRVIGGADPGNAVAVTDVVDQAIFAGSLPDDVRGACSRAVASASLQPAFKVIGLALASPAFQVR